MTNIKCTFCGNIDQNMMTIDAETGEALCHKCRGIFQTGQGSKQREAEELSRLRDSLGQMLQMNMLESAKSIALEMFKLQSDSFPARYAICLIQRLTGKQDTYNALLTDPGDITSIDAEWALEQAFEHYELSERTYLEQFIARVYTRERERAVYMNRLATCHDTLFAKLEEYGKYPRAVFICAAPADKKLALRVADALLEYDCTCWLAARNLPPHVTDAAETIRFQITNAKLFLLISSSNSMLLNGEIQSEMEIAKNCPNLKRLEYKTDASARTLEFQYWLENVDSINGADDLHECSDELKNYIYKELYSEKITADIKARYAGCKEPGFQQMINETIDNAGKGMYPWRELESIIERKGIELRAGRFKKMCDELESCLHELLVTRDSLDELADEVIDALTEAVLSETMVEVIEPCYDKWRSGEYASLNDMKKHIDDGLEQWFRTACVPEMFMNASSEWFISRDGEYVSLIREICEDGIPAALILNDEQRAILVPMLNDLNTKVTIDINTKSTLALMPSLIAGISMFTVSSLFVGVMGLPGIAIISLAANMIKTSNLPKWVRKMMGKSQIKSAKKAAKKSIKGIFSGSEGFVTSLKEQLEKRLPQLNACVNSAIERVKLLRGTADAKPDENDYDELRRLLNEVFGEL